MHTCTPLRSMSCSVLVRHQNLEVNNFQSSLCVICIRFLKILLLVKTQMRIRCELDYINEYPNSSGLLIKYPQESFQNVIKISCKLVHHPVNSEQSLKSYRNCCCWYKWSGTGFTATTAVDFKARVIGDCKKYMMRRPELRRRNLLFF